MGLDDLHILAQTPLFPIFAFLFGANVGSFLNVCIFRMPRNCVTVNHPRWSFCPLCQRRLKWYENQPIIGWLTLRGRCGGCGDKISIRYPLFETVTGLLWLAAAMRYLSPPVIHPLSFLVTVILLSVVVVCAMIDYDLRILPDRLDIPGMIVIPPICFLVPNLRPGPKLTELSEQLRELLQGPLSWWNQPWLSELYLSLPSALESCAQGPYKASVSALLSSLAGLLLGAALIWSISIIGKAIMGREVMGFGDVKYTAMLGAFTGPTGVFITVLLAAFLGSIGGLLSKFASGQNFMSKRDYEQKLGPLSQLFLRPFRNTPIELDDGQPGYQYSGLGSLFSRLATGDSSIPFGPYLSLGAIAVILQPELAADLILVYWPALFTGAF